MKGALAWSVSGRFHLSLGLLVAQPRDGLGHAALQRGPASLVSPIDKTSLAMVLILAALFLGEPLTWKTALGGGLVVLGAIVVALK